MSNLTIVGNKNTTKTESQTAPGSLTDAQKSKLLSDCEKTIKRGQQAFFAVARAIETIYAKELYAPEYKNAAAYFRARWEMSDQEVSKYHRAGKLLRELELHGFQQLPENEAQARELGAIKHLEQRLSVWDLAIKTGEKITALLIHKLANPVTKTEATTSVEPQIEQPSVAQSTLSPAEPLEVPEPVESICAARIHVEMDSTVLADAGEYLGIPVSPIAPGLWEVTISRPTKAALIRELASWPEVYSVKKLVISFE